MHLRRVLAEQPTWMWDFKSGLLHSAMSFSRASTATYFDAGGVLRSASSNVPRFDRDPLTGAPLGYLAEMQSTNLCTRSKALTGASWTATGVTVTDNAVASPDGTTNASTLLESAGTSAHSVGGGDLSGLVTSAVHGVSFSAKNITGTRWVQISIAGALVNFNPATGVIGTISGALASAQARQLPNGWWRFSAFWTNLGYGGPGYGIYMVPAANSTAALSYAGDGTSLVSITDVQFETAGVGVTSVIPTSGATATRAQDVLTMPLASLPGWQPALGGVMVTAYRLNTIPVARTQAPFRLDDGSSSNMVMGIGRSDAGAIFGLQVRSSDNNAIINTGAASAIGVRRKLAGGWGVNRQTVAYDGTLLASTSTTLALPVAPTILRFANESSVSFNGSLESIAYYAGVRTDAFVQQVSR